MLPGVLAWVLLVGCWAWVSRGPRPAVAVAAAGFVVLGAVAWVDPGHLTASHHGLMHAALVQRIADGGLPPESPMLAGAPAGYPWLHHAVLAALPLPSSTGFLLTNALAMACVAGLVGWTAGGPRGGAIAAFVALFATSALDLEVRAVPLFAKALNANSTPLGLVAVALLGLSLDRSRPWAVAAAVAWGGLMYPLVGVSCAVAAVAVAMWRGAAGQRAQGARELAAVGAGAVLPALWGAWMVWGAGVGGDLELASPRGLLRHIVWGGATAMPLLALAWLGGVHRARGVAVVVMLALYAVLTAPAATEYKMLMAAAVLLAPPAARGIERVGRGSWLVVPAMLVPMALRVGEHASDAEPSPVQVAGRRLVPVDPGEAALAAFVRAEAADAVVVDRDRMLSLERPLWVGLDDARTVGWEMASRDILVDLEGQDADVVELRRAAAERALTGREPLSLRRPVLLVLRGDERSAWPDEERVFTGSTAEVIRWPATAPR